MRVEARSRSGVGVLVLIVLPFPLTDFRTVQLATVGAYFIAILGLDVLTGHSGQISLGHGAFMAVGAYTTAILMADHGVRDLWTIPIAAVRRGRDRRARRRPGAAALGPLPRARDVRHRGRPADDPEEVRPLHRRLDRASRSSASRRRPATASGDDPRSALTNNQWLYALTWTIGGRAVPASPGGCSTRASAARCARCATASSRQPRPASTASTYKVAAFGVSAAFAGVAGALFAINVAYVSPDTFPIQLSLYLLVGAVVGFFGSIWGAVIGALLIQFLPDIVRPGPARRHASRRGRRRSSSAPSWSS